jgi:glucan phosphoethanolaminetransferase (alkaline phosphatase superfamily)
LTLDSHTGPQTGALGGFIDFSTLYSFAADVILITHVLFVAFVVFGLMLVYAGFFLKWQWVRNVWFRSVHLVAIGVVVLQSWFGFICPLTTWEMGLRARAGQVVYDGSFIAHWLHQFLYFQAPPWVFIACYTAFGGLVLLSWFLVRPNPASRN